MVRRLREMRDKVEEYGSASFSAGRWTVGYEAAHLSASGNRSLRLLVTDEIDELDRRLTQQSIPTNEFLDEELHDYSEEGLHDHSDKEKRDGEERPLPSELTQLRYEVFAKVAEETDQLPILLMATEPALFDAVDRLRAEAELRLAIVPALAVLAVLLGLQEHPLWLLALVPVALLLRQVYERRTEANDLLADALFLRRAPSLFLEKLKSAAGERMASARRL